ncbi:MAG: hypothetical protein CVV37_02535 [Nitrospira bacterium HGW-Nitrospira-1]|nr:MAG: hypothetical protein CVV37_02535 [Nitrospira bacterium HGW-Nitrospira-1]
MTPKNKHSNNGRPAVSAAGFFTIFLFIVCSLFSPSYSFAEETVITSNSLEYFSETRQYVAKGSAEIKQKDAVITADEITYREAVSNVIAVGKVHYHDAGTSIKAEKAELNLETKTGRLFDADIFYTKKNVYLWGEEIEKRGENSYYSPSAVFTACDAPVPAWCFKGRNVDVVLGERLKAKDATFRIKNVPVMYTPYLWAPILTTRQTGFLMPVVSQSNSRGFGMHIPFFWAISGHRDATFVLDTYSRLGIGTGMEYRFIEPGGAKGYGWAYHIRDTELDKDFWELKGLYENRSADGHGGFLNLNILNEKDFYREFSSHLETRTQRFLESTGELNLPLKNSRLYLLSQYWIDLKHDTADVAQKLPEAGYVLNYTKLGSSLISASLTAANMWRDGGLSAGRIDFYPELLHSFGKDFVVSQRAAVRATAYSFSGDETIAMGLQRTAFEYDVVGHTRLYRKYASFLHVIEPALRYHFIASSDNDLQVFDASELFRKTSRIELSLLNRIITSGTEAATVRLTQEMETYNGSRPFLPLKLEVAINKGVPIKLDATYDVHTGKIETVSSELSLNILKANIAFGQTYNRTENIMLYKAGIDFSPYKRVHVSSSIWYDAKGGGVRDMSVAVRYQRQCWGLRFEIIKKPGDYTTLLMFELASLNK